MHIAAILDWDIQHFDIKTAFLHGVLPNTETVFVEQPPGFEEPGKSDWVWKLNKSLYGMKQASRIWNITFHKVIANLGFKRLPNEWCVYRRKTSSGTTIFAVHVDDIINILSSHTKNKLFKSELRSHLLSPQRDLMYNVGGAVNTLMQTGTACALVLLVNVTRPSLQYGKG